MPHLLDLTTQGDVGTMADESRLSTVQLMDPQALYELWERQPWSAHAIDLERDKADWAAMPVDERRQIAWSLSSFFVGEERVTTQFSGLVMAYETQSEEAFLTTQQVDEARHAQHFNRFYEQVLGLDDTFESRLEHARRQLTDDFVDALRPPPRRSRQGARRRPARHRREGRLRHDLPHGDRGHARADRPELHHPRVRGARHPAGLHRGLPQDRERRAPPRRLRHLVPAAEGRRPRPAAAHRRHDRGAAADHGGSARAARRGPGRTGRCSATAPRRSTRSRSPRSRAGSR